LKAPFCISVGIGKVIQAQHSRERVRKERGKEENENLTLPHFQMLTPLTPERNLDFSSWCVEMGFFFLLQRWLLACIVWLFPQIGSQLSSPSISGIAFLCMVLPSPLPGTLWLSASGSRHSAAQEDFLLIVEFFLD
jgi:hypothetical protein